MVEKRDWQADPSYTHGREVGALNQLIPDGADNALFFGDYGAVLYSLMGDRFESADVLTRGDAEVSPSGTRFSVSSYDRLPSLNTYDVILAAWVDWPKRPHGVIKALREALNDEGCLVVEAADESSEYTMVLDSLRPGVSGSIYTERLALLEALTKAFTVERYQVQTSYRFPSVDDFILYFNQHASVSWDRKLSREEKRRLEDLGDRIGYDDLGEKAVLLRCHGA